MVRPFPLVGGICCATFLLLEAVRSVYFGAMFQQASSFLVGGLVFGVISCAVMSYLWVSDRQQWLQVWKHRGDILRLNVLTALSWGDVLLRRADDRAGGCLHRVLRCDIADHGGRDQ